MASDFDQPDYPPSPEDPPGKPKDRQTPPSPTDPQQGDPNDAYVRGLPDALLDQYLALPTSQTTPSFWLAVNAEKKRRTAAASSTGTGAGATDAGDWIAQAIKAANLPDAGGGDSALWRRYIASDPNVTSSDAGTAASAKAYWTMRIRKAENAPDVLSGKESLYGSGFTDATHHRIHGADLPPATTTPPPSGLDANTLFDLFKKTYPDVSATTPGTSASTASLAAPITPTTRASGQGLRFAAQPLAPPPSRPQLSLLDLAQMYGR